MTVFKTTLECFENNIWGYHLPVSTTVADDFIEGNDRRIICTINGIVKQYCALMPHHGEYYILMNKANRTKLQISIGDEVEVSIEKDRSKYGRPIPESFQVLLDQDDEGSRLFHALTPGKQRSLIYLVEKVKNIDSQLNKGMAILDHLKEMNGTIEFKALNAKIKEYNQRSRLK